MRMILIVLSMILISSCQNIPLLESPVERCGIFLRPQENGLFDGKCRCHLYEITPDNIGRISESVDHPLEYCDRFVAFRPSTSWAELRSWFEDLMIFHNQLEKWKQNYKKAVKRLSKKNRDK